MTSNSDSAVGPGTTLVDTQGHRARDLIAVNAGNTLEWYDWTIYTIFAPYFASQFFRSDDSVSALLATLAVFAVGFITRPLGGWLFGRYADRRGRKTALTLAMAIVAIGSLVIAVSPTYGAVGVLASVILLLARLVQGLAHGGEMGTAVTYLVERAPEGRRALWGSSSWVSVIIGTILATLTGLAVTSLLTEAQIESWGWRVAFGLGGILGLYALWLRRQIQETAKVETDAAPAPGPRKPISERLRPHLSGVAIVMGLSAGGSIMFYTWLIFAPTYAQVARGQDPDSALAAALLAQVVFLAALPLMGLLGDRVGRRPMIIAFGAGFLALSFPLNRMIDGSFGGLFLAMTIALLLLACLFAVNGAVWAEVFPTAVRAAGVAAPLSLATAIFGGTAPYLNTWFASNNLQDVFIWYLMGITAITLLTGLLAPETRHWRLDRTT
ncbi:L-Proline/Glycine betaine transporter ProP [Serinicoccus hydrothermalis]|uniref:L-Proline/Glycine betaine transporter ProP n=1 Tax=Serinicoccus hydrothermalis TaxID=1758689 RepID=A0A1B1NFC0_9MICO|nr:MFS transporter [Serinicoccus hydrothermalis]ANS80093.1 L-Proline/Glycine betaine transporter ProP [Serinicoccus hydrothermalis]